MDRVYQLLKGSKSDRSPLLQTGLSSYDGAWRRCTESSRLRVRRAGDNERPVLVAGQQTTGFRQQHGFELIWPPDRPSLLKAARGSQLRFGPTAVFQEERFL